jgi:endo-1,4-beta-xylanase
MCMSSFRPVAIAVLYSLWFTGVGASQIERPTDIPGCVVWLDAEDKGSLSLRTAGRFGGSPVSRWGNKADSSCSAVQTNSASQPTLVFGAMNGRDAICFDGNSQFLTLERDIRTAAGGASVFVVSYGPEVGSQTWQRLVAAYSGEGNWWEPPNWEVLRPCDDDGNPQPYTVKVFSLWEDGVVLENIRIGVAGPWDWGFLCGYIGEIVIYDRVLNQQERGQVRNYLARRWLDLSACKCNSPTWFNDLISPVTGENLLINPGFEFGTTTGWLDWMDFDLIVIGGQGNIPHSGSYCALAANRKNAWEGPGQSLLGVLETGKMYRISAWVRLENANSSWVALVIHPNSSWQWAGRSRAYNDRWIQVCGLFRLPADVTLNNLYFRVEADGPLDLNFYVDDLEVMEVQAIEPNDWRADADERIERIRKRDAQITVVSQERQPVSGADVQIRQTKHRFGFGGVIGDGWLRNPQYRQFFKEHFEWATIDGVKWPLSEPRQGQVSYAVADEIYDYCSTNGIGVRGHCLFWGIDKWMQDWIKNLSYAPLPAMSELRAAVESRMRSAVNHFKGKVRHWDINNEMLYCSFFADRLGDEIRMWMFQEANRIDPDCLLFTNEYAVISSMGTSLQAYKDLVTDLTDKGAPIHRIGVQGHMESDFDRWAASHCFDSLAELGLPIWVTEFDAPHADEHMRAANIEDFYRIAFSQPMVEGIIMWDCLEVADHDGSRPNWFLVDANCTMNEGLRRYEALMREWTTEIDCTTDAEGKVSFRGFHGTYEITIKSPGELSCVRILELSPGTDTAEFTMEVSHVAGEDFESGDFSSFAWRHSGHEEWQITTSEYWSGTHSARAGSIDDGEESTLSLTLDCTAGPISFHVKTSSEARWDKLTFKIDGRAVGEWSGETDWTEASFDVSQGTRTFEWTYSKNSSWARAQDTAWIDDIIFPIP